MPAYLYDALTARCPKHDKPFLTTPEGRTVSYRELEEGSARIASVLSDLGVEAGDRVAVQVEKSPEAVLLRLSARRRDLPAAEYRLHAGGDWLFSERRGAEGLRLRSQATEAACSGGEKGERRACRDAR